MKKKSLTTKTGQVHELSQEDFDQMRPGDKVLPKELLEILPKRKPGQRGKQIQPTKVAVTLRYSPEVISYFKTTGKGWQNRIDNALKEWIQQHPH